MNEKQDLVRAKEELLRFEKILTDNIGSLKVIKSELESKKIVLSMYSSQLTPIHDKMTLFFSDMALAFRVLCRAGEYLTLGLKFHDQYAIKSSELVSHLKKNEKANSDFENWLSKPEGNRKNKDELLLQMKLRIKHLHSLSQLANDTALSIKKFYQNSKNPTDTVQTIVGKTNFMLWTMMSSLKEAYGYELTLRHESEPRLAHQFNLTRHALIHFSHSNNDLLGLLEK